jgi:hypothetical protein
MVSTVALNRESIGGTGDVPRTLGVCQMLVGDADDMVVKAFSWALRELIRHDAPWRMEHRRSRSRPSNAIGGVPANCPSNQP